MTPKKVLLVVGLLFLLGVIDTSAKTTVKSQQGKVLGANTAKKTVTPTPTVTNTPTPTLTLTLTPTPTLRPVYIPPTSTPTPTPIPPTPTQREMSDDDFINSIISEVQTRAYSNAVSPDATARCNDGTYSTSLSHRTTCSHHGGVAQWL